MNKDKAVHKELRKQRALKYAVYSAPIGITAMDPLASVFNVFVFFAMIFLMFNSFVSGYIFWRIIGGESKTAAFFTGLLTGLFSMILALLLVYVFYLLFYLAIYLLLGGVSYSEGFGSAILLAIMLEFFKISWLVVPISIVIAFIVRHDCKISWFVVPLSIAVAFILLHAFDN